MIYTGVSTVFFNVNPLTPTDGYHALADMMEIPELRPESFHYIGMLIQKYIFRLPVDVPVLSKRKRRIFLIYGPLSIIYTGTHHARDLCPHQPHLRQVPRRARHPLAILTALRMFRKRLRKFTDVLLDGLISTRRVPHVAQSAAAHRWRGRRSSCRPHHPVAARDPGGSGPARPPPAPSRSRRRPTRPCASVGVREG